MKLLVLVLPLVATFAFVSPTTALPAKVPEPGTLARVPASGLAVPRAPTPARTPLRGPPVHISLPSNTSENTPAHNYGGPTSNLPKFGQGPDTVLSRFRGADGRVHEFTIRDVNPGFGKEPGTTTNCENAAVAVDRSLSGRPTVAKPMASPDKTEKLTTFESRFSPDNHFRRIADGRDGIVQTLEDWGDGARG